MTIYDRYIAELERKLPGFRVVRKDRSRLQRAIHYTLVAVTFGGMRAYLDGYQTTIGKTVYVTADWDDRDPLDRYVTMRHEAVHLRQFRRYTLPGMALLYVFLPLPMGLSWFRARFEWEAYAETIRVSAEVHGAACVREPAFRASIVRQFTGPAYGWMWPFRTVVERWYDAVLAELPPATRP